MAGGGGAVQGNVVCFHPGPMVSSIHNVFGPAIL
jgi:hypothetical protein